MKVTMVIILSGAVMVWGLCGCGGQEEGAPGESGKVSVVVSIEPQGYFAERVGGEQVEVEVLVPPGSSPHTYEPTPQQMVRLSEAQLYFSIGVPFEEILLGKISELYESLEIVATHEGIERMSIVEPHVHEEGVEHEHGTGEPDPHIWLDPVLVKQQARVMAEALMRIDPEHSSEYESNLQGFEADLDAVDAEIAGILGPLKGEEFYVYHAAFGYFGRRYGLVQEAVEIGGKDASPRQLTELIDRAKADGVKVIFVQQQFPTDSAKTLAEEIGGVVVPMDPLARDYLDNLRRMAVELKKLKGEGIRGKL